MTVVFMKRRTFEHRELEETETQGEDSHVKVEAETGIKQQQINQCQGLQLTTRS